MKKKNLAIAALGTAAALGIGIGIGIGKNLPQTHAPETGYYINLESVVDWNTNDEEISIMLEDGTEVYAYKSKNIYDGRANHFISVPEN